MGGSPKKNPPHFSRARDYERYRTALNAFITVSDYDKKQIGMIIALSLPSDEEEGDIQGKCLEDIGDKLNADDSATVILEWLDKHFRQQVIDRTIEKIKNFWNVQKKEGQDMTLFMTEFDVAYNAMAKTPDTKLPQGFLMFMLMEKGGLSAQERAMVMTMIDTTKTNRPGTT